MAIFTTMGKHSQLQKLLPELAQALLPLRSWKEATLAERLEFFLFFM